MAVATSSARLTPILTCSSASPAPRTRPHPCATIPPPPPPPPPAPGERARACYRWVVKQGFQPKRIALAGDSAGGGLPFATPLALKEHGDPMPACAAPLSPWVGLEGLGDSMTSKASEDPMV